MAFNLLKVVDETRPPPKSLLTFRPVTEYEWRGTLNPGISDSGSFRAICSLLHVVHEHAVGHPKQTAKIGPNGQLLISLSLFSSGLLSAYEKQEVRERGTARAHPGPWSSSMAASQLPHPH